MFTIVSHVRDTLLHVDQRRAYDTWRQFHQHRRHKANYDWSQARSDWYEADDLRQRHQYYWRQKHSSANEDMNNDIYVVYAELLFAAMVTACIGYFCCCGCYGIIVG